MKPITAIEIGRMGRVRKAAFAHFHLEENTITHMHEISDYKLLEIDVIFLPYFFHLHYGCVLYR